MSDLLRDHDYHPVEDTVRVFCHSPAGVLRATDGVLVYAARYGDLVLWHYAFADRWFKVNLTTDLHGAIVETAPCDGAPAYAFNIDLATPLQLEARDAYAVDLDLDVLVRADGRTYVVIDEDDFERSVRAGRISADEAANARAGLHELVQLVEAGQLLSLLADSHPLGPIDAPRALPVERVPVADVPQVQAGRRLTWTA